jgi:hypothetical protein
MQTESSSYLGFVIHTPVVPGVPAENVVGLHLLLALLKARLALRAIAATGTLNDCLGLIEASQRWEALETCRAVFDEFGFSYTLAYFDCAEMFWRTWCASPPELEVDFNVEFKNDARTQNMLSIIKGNTATQ